MELEPDEAAFLKDATLLTAKPVIYVANVAEDDLKRPARENKYYAALEDRAKAEGAGIIAVSAQIEAELAELADDERVKKADFVIENDGSISDLEKAADEFLAEIRKIARKK